MAIPQAQLKVVIFHVKLQNVAGQIHIHHLKSGQRWQSTVIRQPQIRWNKDMLGGFPLPSIPLLNLILNSPCSLILPLLPKVLRKDDNPQAPQGNWRSSSLHVGSKCLADLRVIFELRYNISNSLGLSVPAFTFLGGFGPGPFQNPFPAWSS